MDKTLRRGSKGVLVEELQTKLNKKIGCNLGIDGIFDEQTLRQVLNFQTMNKLEVNGIVEISTWILLDK